MLKIYILLVLVLLCFDKSYGDCNLGLVCITDKTCPAGEYLKPRSSVYDCCPSCQPGPVPPGVCAAPSNCLPDGRFAPVQCSGDLFTGRCFCSDENGRRIFGQMWRDEATEMTCGVYANDDGDSSSFTTTCSRRRYDQESSGRGDVTLHCTDSGDYEPLQCDSGMCWCAEPKTGQPIISPVLEEDMHRLPCFSTLHVGEQYLRRCESTVHALAVIHREQSEHGTNFIGNPTSNCDYDGSFGSIQLRGSQAYCTGRDGEILGAWQVEVVNIAGMNCNCARDTAVYFPNRGMTVSEVCQANGNYRPNQVVGNRYYCVDINGYPTTGFMDDWPEGGCPEHF